MYKTKPFEKLLRKSEVAEILACSTRSVDRLVVSGELTRVKVLGVTRFKSDEVRALISKGEQ